MSEDIQQYLKGVKTVDESGLCGKELQYLGEVCDWAQQSPDPSSKNGAFLVEDGWRIIGRFYNRFPDGIANTEERWNTKEIKYNLVVHAEAGSILYAHSIGNRVRGSTMICPWYSCCECAKTIIQAGVERIVGSLPLMQHGLHHPAWKQSIVRGFDMLYEAGVECVLYSGLVNKTYRVGGQDIAI